MPTYVYKREDGSTFECVQSIKDSALSVCPTTGQPVRRVIFAPQVKLDESFPGEAFRRKENARRNLEKDPLYTNLPEYEDNIRKFRHKMEEVVDQNN